VCADGYSKSLGYACSECKTGTKAGVYTALTALLSVVVTALVFLLQELLGLNERKTDKKINAKPPGCCMKLKLPSSCCCNFKLFACCKELKLPSLCKLKVSSFLKQLASLPWSKLSTCLEFTHWLFYYM
jgi:hypothetical protein